MNEEKSGSSTRALLGKFVDWLTGRRRTGPPPRSEPSEPSAKVSRHHAGAFPSNESPNEPEFALVWDNSWDDAGIDPPSALDPNLCLVVALFDALDFDQLFRRTGIRVDHDGKIRGQRLPLFFEINEKFPKHPGTLKNVFDELATHKVVLNFTGAELLEAKYKRFSGQLLLDDADISPERRTEYASLLRTRLTWLIKFPLFARVSLPMPLQPCAEASLRDIELPPDRVFKTSTIDGSGVIVGVIDDGCALAHPDFLIPGQQKSRILYLWDPSRNDMTGGWTPPAAPAIGTPFEGMELTNQAINAAIAVAGSISNNVIDEDKVYDYLEYSIDDLQSHGTHVMGIAAGNGQSMMGCEGVASGADIIFVQLPRDQIEQGGPLLENTILEGVRYIFAKAGILGPQRALQSTAPVVVNISYGGYSGAHDGTSPLASGIDERLAGQVDCAVVVSAGNGFEADCHAMIDDLPPLTQSKPLHWIVRPEDPTSNLLEVWYDGNSSLECSVTLPGEAAPLLPVPLGKQAAIVRNSDQKTVGWISNFATNSGFNLNYIRVLLLAAPITTPPIIAPPIAIPPIIIPTSIWPNTAPAPSGTWQIGFKNVGAANVTFHAWIERDDSGKPGLASRQQSRFDPAEADPQYTLAGLATGKSTICVGAYNTATQEVCRYSACGPTRDPRYERKPDVCAPAEEDVAGHGVLSASARRAQPTRMNGTSAAAPQVAGLVALMLQYNRRLGNPPLAADAIRAKIIAGALAAQTQLPPPPRVLLPNRHQDADYTRTVKQEDDWADLIGAGKVSVVETLKLI